MAYRIEHRVGIQAPVEVVWDVLSDVSAWSVWNPLYPQASGRIALGEQLSLTLRLKGEAERQIQPRIMDWEPNAQLVWRLDLLPSLAHTVRYLELEKLSDTGCIFANGEFFHGLVGAAVGKAKRRVIREGFAEMSEALKARAEAVWRERT